MVMLRHEQSVVTFVALPSRSFLVSHAHIFLYFDIACRELIYAGFQFLCSIYLITNINIGIVQLVFFFFLLTK